MLHLVEPIQDSNKDELTSIKLAEELLNENHYSC